MIQPEARALPAVPGAPRLSGVHFDLLREIQALDEHGARRRIHLPIERPLTVFVDGREIVTLMTLGAQPELLVLGYLRNQRLLDDLTTIESVDVDAQSGRAAVKIRQGAGDVRAKVENRIIGTGCSLGTQFSDLMTQVDAIPLPNASSARISRSTLLRVLETARQHDAIHHAAGSVHSCALFCGANLLASIEDVSRHNGVDTITGWMALHGVSGADKILFTTGRLTGEMVMKAAYNGLPIMVSRNGVTAMGYELASRLGMTLFTRAANRRFLCCVGAERFDAELPTD